jgi:hypothetical protein
MSWRVRVVVGVNKGVLTLVGVVVVGRSDLFLSSCIGMEEESGAAAEDGNRVLLKTGLSKEASLLISEESFEEHVIFSLFNTRTEGVVVVVVIGVLTGKESIGICFSTSLLLLLLALVVFVWSTSLKVFIGFESGSTTATTSSNAAASKQGCICSLPLRSSMMALQDGGGDAKVNIERWECCCVPFSFVRSLARFC